MILSFLYLSFYFYLIYEFLFRIVQALSAGVCVSFLFYVFKYFTYSRSILGLRWIFFLQKKIVFERISKLLKLKNAVLIATVLPFGLAGGPAVN